MEKKLNEAIMNHLERIINERIIIDNAELVNRVWHLAKKDAKSKLSYNVGNKTVRKIVQELCHAGILGVLHKYTKKGFESVLIYSRPFLPQILENLKGIASEVNLKRQFRDNTPYNRRMLDLLVYLGELDYVDEDVDLVVI